TEGASGGPFTHATLVALSPSDAGAATIGEEGGTWVLRFTPEATFAGEATVRFTLANAYATSAEATITLQVRPRPDPTRDAPVRGAGSHAAGAMPARARLDRTAAARPRRAVRHGRSATRYAAPWHWRRPRECRRRQRRAGTVRGVDRRHDPLGQLRRPRRLRRRFRERRRQRGRRRRPRSVVHARRGLGLWPRRQPRRRGWRQAARQRARLRRLRQLPPVAAPVRRRHA